ncbi:MAG: hypothetical protein AAGM38_13955, partial [Pseudomonadota bacterium]
ARADLRRAGLRGLGFLQAVISIWPREGNITDFSGATFLTWGGDANDSLEEAKTTQAGSPQVGAGQAVKLAVWLKHAESPNDDLRIALQWMDSSFTQLSQQTLTVRTADIGSSGGWAYLEGTAPSNVRRMRISLARDGVDPTGVWYAGDVRAAIVDGSVAAGPIAAGAIGAAEIADGAVGTAEIADGAVTAAKLGGDVATGDVPADGSITSAKLAALSVLPSALSTTLGRSIPMPLDFAASWTLDSNVGITVRDRTHNSDTELFDDPKVLEFAGDATDSSQFAAVTSAYDVFATPGLEFELIVPLYCTGPPVGEFRVQINYRGDSGYISDSRANVSPSEITVGQIYYARITGTPPAGTKKLQINVQRRGTDATGLWYMGAPRMTLLDTQGPVSMQVFTSSATWTRPDGCRRVLAAATGGGGGGAYGGSTSNAGGGGGAGGTAISVLDVIDLPSIAVTVGAGGAGGVAATPAAAGSLSSFGGWLTGWGGSQGAENGDGGGGGAATFGLISTRGGQGMSTDEGGASAGGQGGASFWGGGGQGGRGSSSTGHPSISTFVKGAGGGGGNQQGADGGDGGDGVVMVLEFY